MSTGDTCPASWGDPSDPMRCSLPSGHEGNHATVEGIEWAGLDPLAKKPNPEPELPPLPEYLCGQCGEVFRSNCDEDDISCPYCSAKRCPHCHKWFGED